MSGHFSQADYYKSRCEAADYYKSRCEALETEMYRLETKLGRLQARASELNQLRRDAQRRADELYLKWGDEAKRVEELERDLEWHPRIGEEIEYRYYDSIDKWSKGKLIDLIEEHGAEGAEIETPDGKRVFLGSRLRKVKPEPELWPTDRKLTIEELARRQGVKPIESLDDLAQPDLWESDERYEEFLAILKNRP